MREGLGAFADGDLTRSYGPVTSHIDDPSGDELGQIATAINGIIGWVRTMVETLAAYNQSAETLREVLGRVTSTAGNVGSSSSQMASTSQAASTEQVSASTEQTSASALEVAATAEQLAGSAEELTRLVARFKVTA